MSGGGGGRRRRGHEEEHENHERWLVTYADMLTVLMALFIVMFAISAVDQDKMAALRASLASSFGSPVTVIDGGTSPAPGDSPADGPLDLGRDIQGEPVAEEASEELRQAVQVARNAEARAEADQDRQAAEREIESFEETRRRIEAALAARGLEGSVRFTIDERGLVVSIVTDEIVFASGSARLERSGREVVDAIGPVLDELPNDLSVDGHTNSVPTNGARGYATNWELSVARAVTVLRHLSEVDGIPAERLTATGYGEQRPLLPDSDPRALAANRRVEVVVLSALTPGQRALLPALAPAAG
jgi:chemotaxis protein MotB